MKLGRLAEREAWHFSTKFKIETQLKKCFNLLIERGWDYRVEDAGNAVGFGEEGAVDDGESRADREPLDCARHHHRFGQQSERVEIAEQNAAQQHEAQFTSGSLKH